LDCCQLNKRRHRNVNERTRKTKRGSAENVHLQRRNGRDGS
jgi:hypothetical protein